MILVAFYTTLRTRFRSIWITLEKHIFCSSVLNGVSRHLDESSPGWNIFDELSQHLDIWQQMKKSSKPPLHLQYDLNHVWTTKYFMIKPTTAYISLSEQYMDLR
jgi:hypothetical protein